MRVIWRDGVCWDQPWQTPARHTCDASSRSKQVRHFKGLLTRCMPLADFLLEEGIAQHSGAGASQQDPVSPVAEVTHMGR